MTETTTRNALGLASLAVGTADLAAPRQIEEAMGVGDGEITGILRVLGVRELVHGFDLLAHDSPIPGVLGRVAGDVLDGVLLATAFAKSRRPAGWAAIAGAVAPLVIADMVAAATGGGRKGRRALNGSRRGRSRGPLGGLRVAILVANGFEQVELERPRQALDEAGAETFIVSPEASTVWAWDVTDWGDKFTVDVNLEDIRPDDFDALLLPGGVLPDAVTFVRSFFEAGKPVAAICHGPWTVVEAGQARGRRMTSWSSLQTDLRNAGAVWVDEEAVVDGNLLTSRRPQDIPAFNQAMIALFARRPVAAR
jgi:deglycase